MRFRLYVWMILAVAIPVQAVAASSPQLACFEHEGGSAPVVQMDCHDTKADDSDKPPSCCGDACPDMMFCATTPAVSTTPIISPDATQFSAPADRYLMPLISGRLSSPFRPPAISIG